MRSYGDLDDQQARRGCAPILLWVAFVVMLLLCSCASAAKPTANSDIRSADGKLVAHVTTTYDDARSWPEKYLGGLAAIVTGIAQIALLPMAPVAP